MFSLASKELKSIAFLIIASLSLVWFADSSAETNARLEKDSLPYVALKDGSDLVLDGREAKKKQIPVLIFFSMEHCPYCMEVEEDFLKPMLRNSDYDSKVMIRKVRIDGTGFVRDFQGQEREPNEFSEEYNVSMVPTVVFLDSQGKKIAPSIIGIANRHYYGGEVDNAIDISLQKIRSITQR